MRSRSFALALGLIFAVACGTPGAEPSKTTFDQSLKDNATLAEEVERLRVTRELITGSIDSNNEKVAELHAKMEELEKSGASKEGLLETKLNQEQIKLSDLGSKIASVEGSMAGAFEEAEKQALTAQLAEAKGAYDTQAAKITDLNKQLLDSQAAQTAMAEKFAKEMSAAKKAYDEQTAKLDAMEEENGRLTQELGQVKEANRKLMEESDVLRTQNSQLQACLSMAQARVQQVEASMVGLQTRYAALQGAMAQAQSELASTKSALSASQARANALQLQLDQLKVRYAELEGKNRTLQAETNAAKADATKARQEAAFAKAEASRAQADAAKARAEAQAATARAAQAQAAAASSNAAIIGNPNYYPKCPAKYYGATFGCGTKQCAKSDANYSQTCEI